MFSFLDGIGGYWVVGKLLNKSLNHLFTLLRHPNIDFQHYPGSLYNKQQTT